jgi:hypothetical protein
MLQEAPLCSRHRDVLVLVNGRAPTLIHVKAIKPATNERRNFAPLHGRRHHGSRHIALSSFADLAGHRDGRMRLRAVYVVSPPQLAASFILDAASVSFSAPARWRSAVLTPAGAAQHPLQIKETAPAPGRLRPPFRTGRKSAANRRWIKQSSIGNVGSNLFRMQWAILKWRVAPANKSATVTP